MVKTTTWHSNSADLNWQLARLPVTLTTMTSPCRLAFAGAFSVVSIEFLLRPQGDSIDWRWPKRHGNGSVASPRAISRQSALTKIEPVSIMETSTRPLPKNCRERQRHLIALVPHRENRCLAGDCFSLVVRLRGSLVESATEHSVIPRHRQPP